MKIFLATLLFLPLPLAAENMGILNRESDRHPHFACLNIAISLMLA